MKKLTYVGFALLLIGLSATPVMADQCQSIKDKMDQLKIQIDKESEDLYEHIKPKVKDPEVQKKIDALKKEFSAAQQELAACNVPPPAPAPTIRGFTATGIGVPDPQVAVGHKYFAAIDTGNYVFYAKSTLQPTAPTSDGAHSIDSLFKDLYKAINENMDMPKWLCDPDHPALVYKDANKTLIRNNFGCIGQTYDARVIYDAPRHRFWVLTALRPFLWFCSTATGQKGLATGGPNGVIWDPDPNDHSGKTSLCHAEWKQSWMHRFAAVAISATNSAGEEDLSKPFHRYVLTETLGDWPQMTVNDHYLVINHYATKVPDQDPIEIFYAEDLANGVQDGTVLKVKPVKTIPLDKLVARRGSQEFAAGGLTLLVNNHGSSNGITYMVSSNGNNLLIFGVQPPNGNPRGEPKLLTGAAIDLGHPIGAIRNNAIFRDGKIYVAAFECAPSGGDPCTKYLGRIVRVPVGVSSDGLAVHAAGPGSDGFLDYTVGNGHSNRVSYENPVIEVTEDRDMVFGFEGVGLEHDHREPAAVKYRIFYHDKGNITDDGILMGHEGSQMPDPADPVGSMDLGGIALDPSDNKTVWISHGYSENGSYKEAVGAVKP